MLVALDLDNVVVDIMVAARKAAAMMIDVDETEIIDTWRYYSPFTHINPVLAEKIITDHAFWERDDILASAPIISGAYEAAHRLADAGILAGYVTRRSPRSQGITQGWIDLNNLPNRPLRVVGHSDRAYYQNLCKSDACRDIGATRLIDDSHNEAARILAAGLDVIVIDHPLGREDRNQWIRENPKAMLAKDLVHAVDHLLDKIAA